MTGWYLTAASVSILVVSHSPHGLEEIHRLLSSTSSGPVAATCGRWHARGGDRRGAGGQRTSGCSSWPSIRQWRRQSGYE